MFRGIMLAVVLTSTPAKADNCTDLGYFGAMLTNLDSHCRDFRLTSAGRRMKAQTYLEVTQAGGLQCVERGKAIIFNKILEAFPDLAKEKSPDGEAYPYRWCLAMKTMLQWTVVGEPDIVEERR